MDNKIHNIGDSLIITVFPNQNGTTVLNGFVDNLVGLTDEKSVLREFRIIEDELFFGDWKELTESSISGKKIKQHSYIEVRYTRQGTDNSGIIEFQSIEFQGDFEEDIINSPVLDRSIFSNIAWNEDTENLAINLFKKLYFRGIIPNYIVRGDNIDVNEDEDYITLFYVVAKFFAIIFKFFKRFEDFYEDSELMLEWLRQNNIQIDESSVTLEQMQFISNHLYDEIRKRGTLGIFHRQGDVVNGVTRHIDGEFIRLIRSKSYDEVLYEYIPLNKIGWCLRQSSPIYRGTSFAEQLNKTKENSQDFKDITKYQTFSLNNSGSVKLGKKEDKNTLLLTTRGDSVCGLGRFSDNVDVSDKLYIADPCLDYEITFMFNVESADNNAKLYFGIESFNANKQKFYDSMITPNDNETTDWFLNGMSLNRCIQNKWYFVRGIIHSYSSDITENVKLNIGFGNNLKFNNKFIKYILPKIYLSSTNATMHIWDYKIRPLVRGTNILPLKNGKQNSHSMGFIQAPKIFYTYCKNNNNSQSEGEITNIIEKYLLPFNMTNILQFINNEN